MRLSEHPLITREAIAVRVAELARQLDADFAGTEPVLVGVLKGALHFTSDLARAMQIDSQIEFLSAQSYVDTESSGSVTLREDGLPDLSGRAVILVEDILDTGRTAARLLEAVQAHGPATLRICTLLDKPARRGLPIEPDYTGFTIDDHFVVGYGLDYNQRYRGLPAVYTLEAD
ncbi:MAG: hypoxanthine phosphoribosyltransferase [Candidatus Hydrogenedens sp.]|nr:hypoxanthine phosphoribosyltransferase [Candidatus Hydrogenedens sp.]